MPTLTLVAYASAYPFITNRIRATVARAATPNAIITSIIDNTIGHPVRTYVFNGLMRNNYVFRLEEIDVNDVIINVLAKFDVVPGQVEGTLSRKDEQIKVDSTWGFNSNTNTFTFNGEFEGDGNKPDYRGWDIVPSELTGRGILVRGLDYSWDAEIGKFTLLQANDVFQANQWYNIRFQPIVTQAQSTADTQIIGSDFEIVLKTDTFNFVAADMGKRFIIEPSSNYIEVGFPPIGTIPQGRKLSVEIGGNACVKFKPWGSDALEFATSGNTFFALSKEKFSMYVFNHPTRGLEWRVCDEVGNFKTVGKIVSYDNTNFIVNAQRLDGSDGSVFLNARFYHECILRLPPSQRVNYDDWNTDENRTKFSLANSSNPLYLNKFRFPDRRGLFQRATNADLAGTNQIDAIKTFIIKWFPPYKAGRSDNANDRDVMIPGGSGIPEDLTYNGADETRPKNYSTNQYVLL